MALQYPLGTSPLTNTTPGRKRRRTDDALPTPSRSRRNTIRTDDSYAKDMSLLFVRNALREKAKGNASDFNQLVARFSPDSIQKQAGTSLSELKSWVSALTHVVSGLERVHAPLVDALIQLPWTTMDDAFVRSYMGFIGMLVSARPEYLGEVLSKLVRGFTFQSGLRATTVSEPEQGEGSSKEPLRRRQVYDRLHALLQRLLSLIPTLSTTLEPLLVRNFPHKRQDKNAQVTYIRNMLRVSTYCPELGDRILATVVDRAIQIDVEIQVELEDLEDVPPGDEGTAPKDPFDAVLGHAEDEDDEEDSGGDSLSDISSDAGSDVSQNGAKGENTTDLAHVTEMITKLDAILTLLFEHLSECGLRSGSIPSPDSVPSSPLAPRRTTSSASAFTPLSSPLETHAARRRQFFSLLTIFDRTIIRTFKSRYTQFLLFWYSSLDPEFADLFQGLLVSRALFEVDQPAITRAAAASYVASLVSRAQFVDRESARKVVGLLCGYLEGQLHEADVLIAESAAAGGSGVGVGAQFGVFYSVAQAVFLIFCFRWRDLLSDQGEEEMDDFAVKRMDGGVGKKWIPELDVFQRLIASPLNPLKVCSINVVKQFAHIAQATGFVYCYGIIENNKRAEWASMSSSSSSMPSSTSSQTPGTTTPTPLLILPKDLSASSDLNAFFPFDPYKLPLSGSYIQGIYREWSVVALDDDEESDGEEEEEEEDDDGLVVPPVEEEEIARSFEGMSISPVRRLAKVVV